MTAWLCTLAPALPWALLQPALASSSSAAAAAAAAGSGAGTAVQPSRASATPTTVAYKEALQHLMATDVSAHRGAVSAGLPPPPGFLARLLCLAPQELRPPALQVRLRLRRHHCPNSTSCVAAQATAASCLLVLDPGSWVFVLGSRIS